MTGGERAAALLFAEDVQYFIGKRGLQVDFSYQNEYKLIFLMRYKLTGRITLMQGCKLYFSGHIYSRNELFSDLAIIYINS